jgi:hypothetical protein
MLLLFSTVVLAKSSSGMVQFLKRGVAKNQYYFLFDWINPMSYRAEIMEHPRTGGAATAAAAIFCFSKT